MPHKRVAVLYGGKGEEHSISCVSVAEVLKAQDGDEFDPLPDGSALATAMLEVSNHDFRVLVERAMDARGIECAVIVKEINPMPGFTPISMYHQAWQATGAGTLNSYQA